VGVERDQKRFWVIGQFPGKSFRPRDQFRFLRDYSLVGAKTIKDYKAQTLIEDPKKAS
jgi:hypothetical protein